MHRGPAVEYSGEQLRLAPARDPGDIIQRAIDEEKPSRLFVLFSGGKDSTVVLATPERNTVNKRTGEACGNTAAFAERTLKRLTENEYRPLERTGRAYCKNHWGQRNAK